MTPLFKKLNFKPQKQICVINAPAEFDPEIVVIRTATIVTDSLHDGENTSFLLAFVRTTQEIEAMAEALRNKMEGDPVIWFAYPKKTSKKYHGEINRDWGWDSIRKMGLDTVRAVSIDDDWTALRFRKSQFIKR